MAQMRMPWLAESHRREPREDEVVRFHMSFMAGKAGPVLGLVDGLAVDELAEAPAAGRGVTSSESLTMNWTVVAGPGSGGGSGIRAAGMRFQASFARMVPSGNGRVRRRRYAFDRPCRCPGMARKSSKGLAHLGGRRDQAATARYPWGICDSKIGDGSPVFAAPTPGGQAIAAKEERRDGGRGTVRDRPSTSSEKISPKVSTSTTACAKARGASCGRLCPMPPVSPVRILAREFPGIGAGIRVRRAIGVAFEGDGGHGDDRDLRRAAFPDRRIAARLRPGRAASGSCGSRC